MKAKHTENAIDIQYTDIQYKFIYSINTFFLTGPFLLLFTDWEITVIS